MSFYGIIDAKEITLFLKNFALGVSKMARLERNQQKLNFKTEFHHNLDPNDEIVVLANLIDWELADKLYSMKISQSKKNTNSHNARIAFGALILQEMHNFTDEMLVRMIKTNPYFQYFLGLEEFKYECPFVESTLVQFRKRITPEMIAQLNESVCQSSSDDSSDDDINTSNRHNTSNEEENTNDKVDHEGKLILDATCAPQDIKYPTDWDLLNKAREKTEAIIDFLHEPMIGKAKKVRTYRVRARKEYLNLSKSKKKSRSKIRKVLRFQLECLQRNLSYIKSMNEDKSYNDLTPNQTWDIIVISELYRQQRHMFESHTLSIEHRIVSLHQPHIRPIVRGKATATVEFGAKLEISVVNGYTYIERISWDAYNEGQTLMDSVERYKERFGYYPKEILADKIYRNRDNLIKLKELGITMTGPKLGRPRKDEVIDKQAVRKAEGERNIVEGRFGEGKRSLSLGRIMAKTKETSEAKICFIILVMNLKKRLRLSLNQFLDWLNYILIIKLTFNN
jgi:transposase, IS5 family